MPIGAFINVIPNAVFVVIHAVALIIGAYFARRMFATGATDFGRGFVLYALAEVSYLTYHFDWTTFLFAHTISEVLDLLAVICFVVGIGQLALAASGTGGRR